MIMDTMKARKSVRKYDETKTVEKDVLAKVLEAGRIAPSARNLQNWKFLVVENKGLEDKMTEACNGQNFIGKAPLTIVVCACDDRDMLCKQSTASVDCSIALTFMMLQAQELGLGTCWIGSFHEDKVRAMFQIPDDYTIVVLTPLGYPDAEAKIVERPRKALDEVVVYNTF